MEYLVNDPTKARSYGDKKDLGEKNDRIQQRLEEGKQYYPPSKMSGVDEWKAIIKQQASLHDKEEKDRLEATNKFKKDYYGNLGQQTHEHEIVKQQLNQIKQIEGDYQKQNDEELRHLNHQKRAEDVTYKSYIANTYKSDMNQHQEKRKEERAAEIAEERERLRLVQQDLEAEKQRNAAVKNQFVQEARHVVEYKNKIKDFERKKQHMDKEQYAQLCSENANREENRENQYKQFFKDFDNDMSRRMNNHMNAALTIEMQKQNQLDQFERKRIEEHNQYLKNKEEQEKKNRLDQEFNRHHVNRDLINQHQHKKTVDKDNFKRIVEERHKEEADYKRWEEQQRQEETDKKKLYKETLDYQRKIMEVNKGQFGTMTGQEKRMNKGDLLQYKNQGQGFQGMVPGIHNINSIGSSPVLRKAREVDPNTFVPFGEKRAFEDVNRTLATSKSLASIGVRSSLSEKHMRGSDYGMGGQQQQGYNPITNPIPWMNQNPYVTREVKAVAGYPQTGSPRSLLAGTAEKNLFAK